jgi:hypothetical protein
VVAPAPRVTFERCSTMGELQRALGEIAEHPHCSAEAVSEYELGVRDGHACAATIAPQALEDRR